MIKPLLVLSIIFIFLLFRYLIAKQNVIVDIELSYKKFKDIYKGNEEKFKYIGNGCYRYSPERNFINIWCDIIFVKGIFGNLIICIEENFKEYKRQKERNQRFLKNFKGE